MAKKTYNYDFSGWATINNIRCADGRTIMPDAFKHCDGMTVPLVWSHNHDDPDLVLGHALLRNDPRGVRCYCSFNGTDKAQSAKQAVIHGDVNSLSIYANHLRQDSRRNVMHGDIKEVSLVLAGANPSALIDDVVMAHGEDEEFSATIYSGDDSLAHSEDGTAMTLEYGEDDTNTDDILTHEEDDDMANGERTVQDVINTMNEEQKKVLYAMVGMALEEADETDDAEHDDFYEEDDDFMQHNIFDNDFEDEAEVLSHSDMEEIFADAKRSHCTLKEACDNFLEHSGYGVEHIDFLFPEAKNVNSGAPDFIMREQAWVSKVMKKVHHVPFSRIKSVHADITADEARALGYMKGNLKKEEVFTLLKRSTLPTTIYKKQKLDRDDVVDITDFDVVAWIKREMRMMLDEEIARAILIGDGRDSMSEDKIKEDCIRPVMSDAELYTIQTAVNVKEAATDAEVATAFIEAAIKSRKNYKGSGSPDLYTTEEMITNCLLLKDGIGRPLYKDEAELAKTLRVKEIIIVPVMEGQTGPAKGDLLGLIVNLADYTVGADKGGSVNMFDDFDIDYNQQKYLIETRCSGALVVPYSTITLELKRAGAAAAQA